MNTTVPDKGREIRTNDGSFLLWRRKADDTTKRQVLLGRVYACENPECECNEVSVQAAVNEMAIQLDPALDASGMQPRIGWFDIDLGTGTVTLAEGSQPDETDDLHEWLVQEVEPELLDALHEHSLRVKGFVRRKKPRLPMDWDPNNMVPWTVLRPGERQDLYPRDGRVFVVEDSYCLNPRCPCRSILLSFIELDGGGVRTGEEIGAARVLLPDLQITEWESFSRSEETLTQVFQAHKERHGERLLAVLQERRRQCHALGHKLVGGRRSQPRKRKAKRRKKRR